MKEGQRLEWKESWRDDFCKTICGFASAEGGVLVVGRNDQGKVMRYEATGLWMTFRFTPALPSSTTPETTPQTTLETTPERILAILTARPSTTRLELAAQLALTVEGIKYHLRKLTSVGRIRHVGSTKAGHWEVLK